MLDLRCNATIIAVQPAANEKLIIKPKNILKERRNFSHLIEEREKCTELKEFD